MFQVEYIGDRSDLETKDEEIDQVKFVTRAQVLDVLFHEDSKEFYKKLVQPI